MRLRHVLHALSAVGTMIVQGASLRLTRIVQGASLSLTGLDPEACALDLELEARDLQVWPARAESPSLTEAHEMDALYLASSLHHGVSVSEVGVPIALGTGGGAEANATERLAVEMLHQWGHFE